MKDEKAIVPPLTDAEVAKMFRQTHPSAYEGVSDAALVACNPDRVRIARAAALSIIPSTTGAVKACAKIFPHLKGKIDGMALRVPVPTGSAAYMAITVKKNTDVDAVHAALSAASSGPLKGILGMEREQLVSADYITDSRSSIVDMDSTAVIDDTLVQLLSWYDNEWGYSMRVTEMTVQIGQFL